jgi:hypothetical protein
VSDQQLGKTQYANFDQIAAAAYNAGFRGTKLVTIVAISGCEDPSGNVGIVNNTPSTGDYSVGIWEVNYLGALMSARTKLFGDPKSLSGSLPAQANAAYQISAAGTNFTPWTTYTSGCYTAHVPAATVSATKVSAMSSAQRTNLLSTLSTTPSTSASTQATDTGIVSDLDGKSELSAIESWGRPVGGYAMIVAGALLMLVSVAIVTGNTGKLGALAPAAKPFNDSNMSAPRSPHPVIKQRTYESRRAASDEEWF